MNRIYAICVAAALMAACGEKSPESYLDGDRVLILCKPKLSGEKDVLFYDDQRKKYRVNNIPEIYNYIITTVDGSVASISSLEESNYDCAEVKKPSISQ